MAQDSSRVILAADGLSTSEVLSLVKRIGKRLYAVKVHELFDRDPRVIGQLLDAGATRVWVDAKLHDIPETVRRRCEAIRDHGARIVSVHASGGVEMMRAAVASGIEEVYAVTILTSLSEDVVKKIYGRSPSDVAKDLALIAAEAGVHGIVCSPQEVKMLRAMPELASIKLITPGIRMPGQSLDDQQRVGTPEEAIRNGSDYLVIGRPITKSENPVAALDAVEESI